MPISFLKMHGLGNDFVIVDARKGLPLPGRAQITRIANRHTGVGCDQFIVLQPGGAGSDVFMRIYNPDGSEAGACGNATRCVASEIMAEQRRDALVIETVAGKLLATRGSGGIYVVDMGPPRAAPAELAFAAGPLQKPVTVDMGNPHAVFFVEDAEAIDLEKWGPVVETAPPFPHKTNVEIVQVLASGKLRMRVWERAAGITLACGSGACATLVAAAFKGLSGRKAQVVMDGGPLEIEWRESDGHVLMGGPVAKVFEGVWRDE